MPELPEVETLRRSLLPSLIGRTITFVALQSFPAVISGLDPETFSALVADRKVVDIRRRGKYLLIDLDDESGFIIHLRMTGNLTVLPALTPPVRFEEIAFMLDDGQSLRFSDQRKFGSTGIEIRAGTARSRIHQPVFDQSASKPNCPYQGVDPGPANNRRRWQHLRR
jgi:formamidopyrimidine-DNA glycosylase